MIRLTKNQIIMLHEQLVKETGGSPELRDEGLLDSAVEAIYQTFDGKELYPTLQAKAARLCYGLVKNHSFVDGNKRIGVHSMLILLSLNGFTLSYSQEELYTLILGIADGSINYDSLLQWVLEHQE